MAARRQRATQQGDEAEQHDEGARRLHATPTPLRSEGERAQRRAQPACGQQRRKGAESEGGHGERAGRHRAAWVAEADGGGMSAEGVDQRARQEAVEDYESKRCAGIGRLQQALQRAGRELAAETPRGARKSPEVAEELQADEELDKAAAEGKAALRQQQGLGGWRTQGQ